MASYSSIKYTGNGFIAQVPGVGGGGRHHSQDFRLFYTRLAERLVEE